MIVPMNKVTILCLTGDRPAMLDALRDIGVLHVVPVQAPEGPDLSASRDALAHALKAADILAVRARERPLAGAPGPTPEPGPDLAARVIQAAERTRDLARAAADLAAEAAPIEPFGNFDPAQVTALRSAGIEIRLYQAPSMKSVRPSEGMRILSAHETRGGVCFVAAGTAGTACEGAREVPIPARSLREVRADQDRLAIEAEEAQRRLDAFVPLMEALRHEEARIRERIAFVETREGMGGERSISYVRGFCPADAVPRLREAAARHGWGLTVDLPGESDTVPTLIRNPAWVRPIQFLLRMIGVVPGYREVDISAAFLIFYSVFFAMLVGDAGYGALFLGLTLVIRKTMRSAPKELPRLLGVLSICTIAWGVLTGSYFGIRFESLPGPMRFRVDWLTHEPNLMSLCFLIGAIHLTLAHAWNAIRAINSLIALAQAGWVAVTWSMYFLARNMILDQPLPGFFTPLLIAGLAAVILFMTPMRAMKAEWPNHIMLPLSVIGCFGDLVSYVRLFAVGSAGAAISLAFNDMAIGDGIRSFWAGLGAAVVLFLAHTLNIMLSALGVIVHGVRLNTLEFSGHLGMQWTGTAYKPFARRGQTE